MKFIYATFTLHGCKLSNFGDQFETEQHLRGEGQKTWQMLYILCLVVKKKYNGN